jgi:hypothetical protein
MLLVLGWGCGRGAVRVRFEATERAPVAFAEVERIAVAWFDADESEERVAKDVTDLVRRTLETREGPQSYRVTVFRPGDWAEVIESSPREWFEEEHAPFWHRFLDVTDAELLVFGAISFESRTYQGFVRETVEDPYTGRPYRRTVQRQLTSFDYSLRLGLADLLHAELVFERKYERTVTVEGTPGPGDFFALLEPHVQEFLDTITGRSRDEERFLLR